MSKIKENMKRYLLVLTPEEHRYIKSNSAKLGLSIKELIILSTHKLLEHEKAG